MAIMKYEPKEITSKIIAHNNELYVWTPTGTYHLKEIDFEWELDFRVSEAAVEAHHFGLKVENATQYATLRMTAKTTKHAFIVNSDDALTGMRNVLEATND